MSNIKNINPIPKNIYDAFEQEDHSFLVKVIVKNPQGNFSNAAIHVASMDEVYKNIAPDHVVRCKVLNIGTVVSEGEAILKMKAKEHMKIKEKEKRLAQYLELKKEFESQPIPEETLN